MIRSFFQGIFIVPIRFYQFVLSPFLQSAFGMKCRYEPSCSHYMIGAIKEWGVVKGVYLGSKRIFSCNPWGGHGFDPVPKKEKSNLKDGQ